MLDTIINFKLSQRVEEYFISLNRTFSFGQIRTFSFGYNKLENNSGQKVSVGLYFLKLYAGRF